LNPPTRSPHARPASLLDKRAWRTVPNHSSTLRWLGQVRTVGSFPLLSPLPFFSLLEPQPGTCALTTRQHPRTSSVSSRWRPHTASSRSTFAVSSCAVLTQRPHAASSRSVLTQRHHAAPSRSVITQRPHAAPSRSVLMKCPHAASASSRQPVLARAPSVGYACAPLLATCALRPHDLRPFYISFNLSP
jgi:hypothetical protein